MSEGEFNNFIDDLITFGEVFKIPEERGLTYLMKRFKSVFRVINQLVGSASTGLTNSKSKVKTYSPPPLPEHLRKNKNRRFTK